SLYGEDLVEIVEGGLGLDLDAEKYLVVCCLDVVWVSECCSPRAESAQSLWRISYRLNRPNRILLRVDPRYYDAIRTDIESLLYHHHVIPRHPHQRDRPRKTHRLQKSLNLRNIHRRMLS